MIFDGMYYNTDLEQGQGHFSLVCGGQIGMDGM